MYYDEPTVSDVLLDTLVIIGNLALLGGGGTNLAFSILFFQAADYFKACILLFISAILIVLGFAATIISIECFKQYRSFHCWDLL